MQKNKRKSKESKLAFWRMAKRYKKRAESKKKNGQEISPKLLVYPSNKEEQIKRTLRFHLKPIWIAKINKLTDNSAVRSSGKRELSFTVDKITHSYSHHRNHCWGLSKSWKYVNSAIAITQLYHSLLKRIYWYFLIMFIASWWYS